MPWTGRLPKRRAGLVGTRSQEAQRCPGRVGPRNEEATADALDGIVKREKQKTTWTWTQASKELCAWPSAPSASSVPGGEAP